MATKEQKRRIISLWAVVLVLFTAVGYCILNTTDIYAAKAQTCTKGGRCPKRCKKPYREYTWRTMTGRAEDGYTPMMLVSSNVLSNFSELGGGTDGGVSWACDNRDSNHEYIPSAIIFAVNSVSEEPNVQTRDADLNQDDPQKATRYTFNTDIPIKLSGTTPVKLMGLVHYDVDYLKNATNYAIHIGFCAHKNTCNGKSGGGTSSINWDAARSNADGIVSSDDTDISLQRQGENVNSPMHVYSGWTRPYSSYYTTININGATLINKIKNDNNLEVSSNDFRNAVKAGTATNGWVKLYIHRCWSNDGSGMLSNDTCKEGALYLTVSIPKQEDPATTFDGSVVASLSGCSDKTNCEVSSEKTTVSFEYKMSRANNGKDGNVSTSWSAYYHSDFSGNISSTAGASGTVTYAKNTSLTGLSNNPQSVEITLNPGDSKKVCQKLVFNGTVDGNGTQSNSQTRSDCITVKRRNNSHDFAGSVSASVKDMNPTETGGERYETESHTATGVFSYNLCRKDKNDPASQPSYWKTFHGGGTYAYNSTADKSGTDAFSKAGTSATCKEEEKEERALTLTAGEDKTFCGTIGWIQNVKESGIDTSTWKTHKDCVTLHEYAWYTMSGRVTFSTDATKKGDYYWTDTNKTKIQFSHQFSTDTTVAIKPKFKNNRNSNLGSTFNVTGDTYVQGNLTTKNDGWKTSYNSPTSAKGEVDVAKDDGTTFKETLTYYPVVREDSGNYRKDSNGNMGTASNELTVRRYKTTFTGSTAVYIKNDTSTNYANVDEEHKKIKITGTSYPVSVPVTFIHTVKRNPAATSAPYDSPNKKRSTITTSIEGTTGFRSTDDHGTARTGTVQETQTKDLGPGEDDTYTDSFTAKVYPEQTITLCQQLTYRSEIQGDDATKPSTTATKQCITLYMDQATCPNGFNESFGIKESKNLMKVDVYKNGIEAENLAGTSGIKAEGNTSFIAWAKPTDQIRFDYSACAGGDLAQQYDVANNKTTKYKISTNKSGNLFGDALSSGPNYDGTEKEIGTTNATPGTGPFSGGKYTKSVTSPSGNNVYACPYYSDGISDFYRIQAYFDGLSSSAEISNCKSATLGSAPTYNDLGKTIQQTATWTDTQYHQGKPVTGHNGETATITAQVKVPYNYKNKVWPSGKGGYIIPGNDISETIVLDVQPRENPLVGENYSTVTKETKYQLVEIIIKPTDTTTPSQFNGYVGKDTLFRDDNGSKNLKDHHSVCTSHGYTCNLLINEGGKRFDSTNDTSSKNIATATHKIPSNIEPGTKYCYVAAVWPSDSHNNPSLSPTADSHNNPAMVEAGVSGYNYYWQVSGATCYTTAKRPSIAILGGDAYAQNYISARVQKYPEGSKQRIFGSWSEYAAISGNSLQGFGSGASLWGGSDIITDHPVKQTCAFSAYTFSNDDCKNGNLGSMKIDTTTSSNPETIAKQMITRYTRTDDTGKFPRGNNNTNNPLLIEDAGTCKYQNGTYVEQYSSANSTFSCIGDTGAKYTHVKNNLNQPAYIPNTSYCMVKGDTNNSRTSIIHVDNTLVVGGNMYYGKPGTGNGCIAESYGSISEIPQSILIAKKIIIKSNVTYLDTWLIADEIITCDPSSSWRIDVPISDINSRNCNEQLTINGPVMAKNIKLYRTHGGGYTYNTNGTVKDTLTASPAEIFTMGPEVYLWSFNQAQRYSQATTTYARELAPRY